MNTHILKPGCVQACPACPHRHLTSIESLEQKQGWIMKRLGEFAGIVEPIKSISEENSWNYRTKVCLATEYNGSSWNIGVRRGDHVISIHDCPVQHLTVNQNIRLLSQVIPGPEKFPLAYYMQSGAQLSLVVKCREIPDLGWLNNERYGKLQEHGVEGLWLHMHPSTGKKVTGKGGWYLAAGKSRSINKTGLIYGPASFQQVIPKLYADSLQEASRFLASGSRFAVIDLYCGIGASLRQWIASGAQTIGVEISGEALECAAYNAPGAVLLRGACTHRIPQLHEYARTASSSNREILVYANPPRTGLEMEVTAWISQKLRPQKIAYLSCSAGTFYRDLKYFSEHGFEPKRIIPYDFFPQTLHVEMLALIEREE